MVTTATVSLHAGADMQLHPLYSLTGALLGTAMVCALLLWAFTQPLPLKVPSQLVKLSLVTIPASPPQRIVRLLARRVAPLRHSTITHSLVPKPVVIPDTRMVQPITSPAPLDLSLPGLTFAPPPASALVPRAFNPYSDLSRALTAPPPLPTMKNGGAYRSEYGFGVVKADGRCAEMQTIHIGPSPSVKANVAFAMPCPGEYRSSMTDELEAWADRYARIHHPPPG